MDGWIDLGAFSTKYGVSQSTLRRRIRNKAIPFRMERGKYLLKDSEETLSVAPLFSRQGGGREDYDDEDFADEVIEASETSMPLPVRQSVRPALERTQEIARSVVAPTRYITPAPVPTEPLHDPVEQFLKSEEIIPIFLREDYERLLVENRRLKMQISELETLVKALEAETGL